MPKNKKPVARKVVESPEQKSLALTRQMVALADYLAGVPAQNATTRENTLEFSKLIKKSLHQKNDDVLYEALDWARQASPRTGQFLKEAIEEIAEIVVIAREGAAAIEINAFVIPVFLHTTGGLKASESFQDQEGFELLTQSLQRAGLESPDATVVLVNHGYGLDAIDSITFSHLHEMVRDAHAAMLDMRAAAASAIERSYGDGVDEPFGADDEAVELRFLLGFAMKSLDDPFYRIPTDAAASEAWFAARETRFQRWAGDVAPLVKRCFGAAGRAIDVHFLYQDLFHAGKERGIGEYFTLQMMSDLNYGLIVHGVAPAAVRAVIGLTDLGDDKVLRVNLHALASGDLLASADKPLQAYADWDTELADVQDALSTLGVAQSEVVSGFEDETEVG